MSALIFHGQMVFPIVRQQTVERNVLLILHSHLVYTLSGVKTSPERYTAPHKLELRDGAERLGEESNSPLSLHVPNVMYTLDGGGILYTLKKCRPPRHFPEPDIATTKDTQELKELRSVHHGRVPCIQRVFCTISRSEAS